MSDATPMSDDDLRMFAQSSLYLHDPQYQEDNPYARCALCHYTRHPCDVYDLAAAVLRLLDRQTPPACPICGVWHEGHYHHVGEVDVAALNKAIPWPQRDWRDQTPEEIDAEAGPRNPLDLPTPEGDPPT